jgi:GTP pyrophosphokinase
MHRFTGGVQGTLWYYQSLVETFNENPPHAMVDELAEVVRQIQTIVENERSGG